MKPRALRRDAKSSDALSPCSALCVSGAGNRFLLVDARGGGLPAGAREMARRAREITAPVSGGFVPDGLLFVTSPACADASLRMVILNADGTRPQACGNGLRCLTDWAVRAGLLQGGEGVVETDGGLRAVRWSGTGEDLRVEVCLGGVAVVATDALADLAKREALELPVDEPWPVHTLELANPHIVVCVPGPDGAAWIRDLPNDRFAQIARALAQRTPHGANVELIAPLPQGGVSSHLFMRVFERGVGETEACGTGSAAAAWVAQKWLGVKSPVAVHQRGGILTVDRDASDELWLSGPVIQHGIASFSGATWDTSSTS